MVYRKFQNIRWVLVITLSLAIGLSFPSTGESLPGAPKFSSTGTVDRALNDIYDLRYDAAKQRLKAWLHQHPDDLRAWNYLGNATLDQEMFKEGLFSTGAYAHGGAVFGQRKAPLPPDFENKLLEILQKAQTLAEHRLAKNPNDQDALYWDGVTHGTRSEFYFALKRSYLAALREGLKARKDHLKLYAENPHYTDALLVIGIADYAVGSFPWYLKIFATVAGFRGSRSRGIAELKQVSEKGHWAREDAKFVLVAIYRREKMYPQEIALLQDLARSFPDNLLVTLEMAHAYGKTGGWHSAAHIYDQLLTKVKDHQPGSDLISPAKAFYLAGKAHEHLDQPEEALRLYEAAGKAPGRKQENYKADLAAAHLCRRLNRLDEARRNYQRVADAAPNTQEGKAALRALRRFN